jgi:hypothetical protein
VLSGKRYARSIPQLRGKTSSDTDTVALALVIWRFASPDNAVSGPWTVANVWNEQLHSRRAGTAFDKGPQGDWFLIKALRDIQDRNFVRFVRNELPTPSARDVRCRALQRQNKCGTKRIMGNSRRNAEIVFRTGVRE